jgi:hypothetical protein
MKCPIFCPILAKFGFSGQIFVEIPSIKIHENPFSWSRGEMWERTDGRTDMNPIGISGDDENAPTDISLYTGALFLVASIVYHLIASFWYEM